MGGFSWFQLVSVSFRWLQVVHRFSKYAENKSVGVAPENEIKRDGGELSI